MKDCQTVKYDWLDCVSELGLMSDWFAGWGSMEELGEFARRMHEVQGTGMTRVASTGNIR